ncbi:ArsR/SmtB family transcription factor [Chitinivibrio alkaliphilus]|uniref:Transcriptional regulator, ArsR family n=1 Tax=Chitinivibrio alkaliphilus ACht1 TaxID=1313304 RepID=U7D637_9BACT|nr:transcriptional regulator, ArsR family [Chitinivibrio alkaliphilus ACht1]
MEKGVVKVCRALGDKNRFAIVSFLLESPYCIRALSKKIGISESAISQHVRILKELDILSGEKRGYYMHYSVNRPLLRRTGMTMVHMSEQEKCTCPSQKGCRRNGRRSTEETGEST